MAMLHIMAKVRDRWTPRLELAVIHFNHKLRKESDEEVIIKAPTDQCSNSHIIPNASSLL